MKPITKHPVLAIGLTQATAQGNQEYYNVNLNALFTYFMFNLNGRLYLENNETGCLGNQHSNTLVLMMFSSNICIRTTLDYY